MKYFYFFDVLPYYLYQYKDILEYEYVGKSSYASPRKYASAQETDPINERSIPLSENDLDYDDIYEDHEDL